MERVIYDVSVENTSMDAVTIPWSPVPLNRRDRPTVDNRLATFSLVVKNEPQPDYIVDSFHLYGSPTIPESLKEIKPGQRVVLRLPATVSGSGYQNHTNAVLHPSPHMRATATLFMYNVNQAYNPTPPTIRSDNTLPFGIFAIPAVPVPRPDGRPPVIERVSGTNETSIRLTGYRLGADIDEEGVRPRVYLSQGLVQLEGKVGSRAYMSNDRHSGPQLLDVTIPNGLVTGEWQLHIEAAGKRSGPFAVTVVTTNAGSRVLPAARTESSPEGLQGYHPPLDPGGLAVIDAIFVGPARQHVALTPGPDRPGRFEAVEDDELELHFTRPEPGDFSITFQQSRVRDVRVTPVRVDEYRLRTTIPAKVRGGPWQIVVGRQDATQVLPVMVYVHPRP